MKEKNEMYLKRLFRSFLVFLVVAFVLSILIDKRYGYYILQGFIVFEMIYSVYYFLITNDEKKSD